MKAELLHSLAFTPAIGPPPPITTQDATGMSRQERRARAAEVRRYLAGHYFDSDRDRGIRQRLTALIEGNAQSLTGTKDVAIVTGDNVLGLEHRQQRRPGRGQEGGQVRAGEGSVRQGRGLS